MIEVLKQALEALEDATKHIFLGDKNGVEANIRAHKQCESLRQAIREHAMYEVQRLGQEIEQEPVAWMSLMKEARDNCKASIVEDGISEMRKEYRIDLERRLTDCINTHPPQRTEPFFKFRECEDSQAGTATPPQRTWVGLTDDETEEIWQGVQASDFHDCVQPFARAIEAKLKEKNNA